MGSTTDYKVDETESTQVRMRLRKRHHMHKVTRGMQSIVGRAELPIAVQPHRRAAELSGLLHIVLLYEVGIR